METSPTKLKIAHIILTHKTDDELVQFIVIDISSLGRGTGFS